MPLSDADLALQIEVEKTILARIRQNKRSTMREADTILYIAEQAAQLRLNALNAELGIGVPLPAGSLPTLVLQIGDSIGYGEKAGPWPAITHLGYDPKVISINNANSIGGRTMAQIAGELPNGLDPFYDGSRRCVAIIQRGTNDIGNDKRSAADTYAILAPLVAQYQQQGFYVGVCTLLPRNGSNYPFTAADQAQLTEYNRLIRANSAGGDFLIDFKADPVIGVDGAENGSLYADGLHPNRAGQERLTVPYRAALEPTFKFAIRPSRSGTQPPYFRMVDLHQMAEIKNGSGFDYKATVAADFGHGVYGYSTIAIPTGGNGYFMASNLGGRATTGSGIMLGLTTKTAPTSFYDCEMAIYTTSRRGNYSALEFGNAEKDTGIPIAAGDIMMVQRVGSTISALISKDNGASWATAYVVGGITKPVIAFMEAGEPTPQGTLSLLRFG